jgi:hypothetical protein
MNQLIEKYQVCMIKIYKLHNSLLKDNSIRKRSSYRSRKNSMRDKPIIKEKFRMNVGAKNFLFINL